MGRNASFCTQHPNVGVVQSVAGSTTLPSARNGRSATEHLAGLEARAAALPTPESLEARLASLERALAARDLAEAAAKDGHYVDEELAALVRTGK